MRHDDGRLTYKFGPTIDHAHHSGTARPRHTVSHQRHELPERRAVKIGGVRRNNVNVVTPDVTAMDAVRPATERSRPRKRRWR